MVYEGRSKTRIGSVNTNQGRNMSGLTPTVGSSLRLLSGNRNRGNFKTCGPVLYHGNVIATNTPENSLCVPPAPVSQSIAGGVGHINASRLGTGGSGTKCSGGNCSIDAGNGLTKTGNVLSVTAADAAGNYTFSGNVSVPSGIITGDLQGTADVANLAGEANTASNAKPGSNLATQIEHFKQYWGRYNAGSYATSNLLDKPANFNWVWDLPSGDKFTLPGGVYTKANFPTDQILLDKGRPTA